MQLGEEAAKHSNADICPLYLQWCIFWQLLCCLIPPALLRMAGLDGCGCSAQDGCDLQELRRRVQAAGPGRKQNGDLAWKPRYTRGKAPPVLRRSGFSPVGFKAQHAVALAREFLGRFLLWPFYSTQAFSLHLLFWWFFMLFCSELFELQNTKQNSANPRVGKYKALARNGFD